MEDLDDTMRSQLAVDPSGPLFAFYSPLGHGIAFCEEDTPTPILERALGAAVASEYLRLTVGGDLPPALRDGLADLIARSGRAQDGAQGGIGAAGVACVRGLIERGEAIPLRALMSLDPPSWRTRVGSAGGHTGEQAASVIRFLAQLPRGTLVSYLRALSGGMTSDQAIEQTLGVRSDDDWVAFDAQWRAFALKERAVPMETVRERLALLAAGLVRLAAEGSAPVGATELARDLRDRSFAFPDSWRPGFSRVSAGDDGVFSPGLAAAEDAGRRAPAQGNGKLGAFTLVAAKGSARPRAAPLPEIHVDGAKPRLKVNWHQTRAEPEAPWVWSIVPMD